MCWQDRSSGTHLHQYLLPPDYGFYHQLAHRHRHAHHPADRRVGSANANEAQGWAFIRLCRWHFVSGVNNLRSVAGCHG